MLHVDISLNFLPFLCQPTAELANRVTTIYQNQHLAVKSKTNLINLWITLVISSIVLFLCVLLPYINPYLSWLFCLFMFELHIFVDSILRMSTGPARVWQHQMSPPEVDLQRTAWQVMYN